MYKIYFIILLIGLFSACIEVVDLDVEETPHELVVNCFFTEGQPFVVNVSRLAAYPDLTDRNIENATVSIYENDILKGTLKHTENGIYTRRTITPTYGNMYSIKVEVPGYPTATANDSLPQRISIDSGTGKFEAGKDNEGDYYDLFTASFNDKAETQNYYSINLKHQGIKYDTHEKYWHSVELFTNDPVILAEGISPNDYNMYLVFNDGLFANQDYKVAIKCVSYYEPEDQFALVLNTGTANYYQYRKRLLKHEPYSYEDPFKPYSPVPLYSNVSGGQGIFAGYQRDIYYLNFSE